VISGVLALLLGLFVTNNTRGQRYEAGQHQNPHTKKFITEDTNFWRCLLGGLAIAVITAYFVPKLTPAINNAIQEAHLSFLIVRSISGFVFLKSIFKKSCVNTHAVERLSD